MDRNAKLNFLARIMIDLYGKNAAMVARRRVTECAADRDVARIWREVLAIVESRQLECIRPPGGLRWLALAIRGISSIRQVLDG